MLLGEACDTSPFHRFSHRSPVGVILLFQIQIKGQIPQRNSTLFVQKSCLVVPKGEGKGKTQQLPRCLDPSLGVSPATVPASRVDPALLGPK